MVWMGPVRVLDEVFTPAATWLSAGCLGSYQRCAHVPSPSHVLFAAERPGYYPDALTYDKSMR